MYREDKGRVGMSRVDGHGNLLVTGSITRTGVFTYNHRDGSKTRELRHPDDVFNPESLESFVQLPVTDNHPTEGDVSPQNVKRLAVGNLGDSISHLDSDVLAGMVVRDAKVQHKIDEGKTELSCGYHAKVIPEEGVYKGERYDHRQTEIRGNHVAIVAKGRAGNARLLLDAEDAIMESEDLKEDNLERLKADPKKAPETDKKVSEKISQLMNEGKSKDQAVAIAHEMFDISRGDEDINQSTGEKTVKIIKDGADFPAGEETKAFKVDGLEIDIPDSGESAIKMVLDQRDSLIKELKQARSDVNRIAGERDALREDAITPPERLDAMVQERSQILEVAESQGLKKDSLAKISNSDVKRQIVAKRYADTKADASDENIQGRYDAIVADQAMDLKNDRKRNHLGGVTSGSGRTYKDGDESRSDGEDEPSYRENLEKTRKDAFNGVPPTQA